MVKIIIKIEIIKIIKMKSNFKKFMPITVLLVFCTIILLSYILLISSQKNINKNICEEEFSKCLNFNFEKEIAKLNGKYLKEPLVPGTCAKACQSQHLGNDPAINACVGINTISGEWFLSSTNCEYCDEKTQTKGQYSCYGYIVNFLCNDSNCLDK